MTFPDEITITVEAGSGGPGAIHFRRAKYQSTGPPDGGHGGQGGSIWLEADHALFTLKPFRYRRNYKAHSGERGQGERAQGRSGKDLILKVPCGTVAIDEATQTIIGEVLNQGDRLLIAQGGRGGLGNHSFKSSVNRSPEETRPPDLGETKRIKLELKLIADIGLIGFPSAGKSSLLNCLTRAKSPVGSYPFTTLSPELGIWTDGILDLIIADLPGLIEDAHQGKGLGVRFLKHIQRCQAFIWVLNGDSEEAEPWRVQLTQLQKELEAFDETLLQRPSLYLINKVDTWTNEEIQQHKDLIHQLVSVEHEIGLEKIDNWLKKISKSIEKNK
jgi:GTP-binding protein